MELLSLMIIASHMLGDYILQTDVEARGKFSDLKLRANHVHKYTACFFWALGFFPLSVALLLLAGIWLTHWHIDSRRWVPADHPWPAKAILVDQTYHAVTLLALFALALVFR